jgi:hypothetical protein
LDVLDGRGAQGGEREGDAGGIGRPGSGDLALGLHETGEPRGGDAEGQRGRPAEDLAGCVHVLGRPEDVGVELDVLEGLPGPAERDLPLRCAVGVVEGGLRSAAFRDGPQVPGRQRGVQAAALGVQFGLLELQKVEYFAGLGKLAFYHGLPHP